MVIINEEMNSRVKKALCIKKVDEQGKFKLQTSLMIMRYYFSEIKVIELARGMMASGGFGRGFYEFVRMVGVAGKNEKVSCEVYSGVKSYASRTKITLPKPVTTENTKFRSKFRKKRDS